MEACKKAVMTKKRRHQPRPLAVRVVPDMRGGRALEVAGVIQSLEVGDDVQGDDSSGEPRPAPFDGYWGLMLPPRCPTRALLLGLGGGTIARLLARRCPATEMVGIERNAEVLAAARGEFGLDALPRLRIVLADAFRWVADSSASEVNGFDLICLDLFDGGRLAQGALGSLFLRSLANMLTADGVLTINLFASARTSERLERLRRLFIIERALRHHGNLVIHLRPVPPPPAEPHSESSEGPPR